MTHDQLFNLIHAHPLRLPSEDGGWTRSGSDPLRGDRVRR